MAEQAHQACLQLERDLRQELRGKNFYEPSVRLLRQQLCSAYEAVLLQHYAVAQERDVEAALWKNVFYKPIEEFRKRIRQAAGLGNKGIELLRKVKGTFRAFLTDAAAFYKDLIIRLQQEQGDVGAVLALGGQVVIEQGLLAAGAGVEGCRVSVYRCLVCLGDLARYEAAAGEERQSRDWMGAGRFYRQAQQIFPSGGNAYNQLAVLATLADDKLSAVYFYFRSLAVAMPFGIARENLLLLFEANRVSFEGLLPRRGSDLDKLMKAMQQQPVNLLLQEFTVRLIHLHGLLFTKVDVDTFPAVLKQLLPLFRVLFARQGTMQAMLLTTSGEQKPDNLLQMVTVMLYVAYHNCVLQPQGQKLGFSEVLRRTVLVQHCSLLALTTAGELATIVQRSSAEGAATHALLPVVAQLLDWVVTVPDLLRVPEAQQLSDEDAQVRTAFAIALAGLARPLAAHAEQQGWALPGGKAAPAGALPEDLQLRGLLPLEAAHSRLDMKDSAAPQDHVRLRVERLLAAAATIAGHEHPQQATRHAGLRAAWRELAAACVVPGGGAQENAAAPRVSVSEQQQADAELLGAMDATGDDLSLGAAITATLRQGQAAANGGLQQPPGRVAPHASVAATPGAAQQTDVMEEEQEQADVMEEEEEILYQPGQPQRAPQQQPPQSLPHQEAAGTGLPSSSAPLQLQQPRWQFQGLTPEQQPQYQVQGQAPQQQPQWQAHQQVNGGGGVLHAPGQQPLRQEAGTAEGPAEVGASVGLLQRPAAQQQWQASQLGRGAGVPFSLGPLQQPPGQQQAQWLPQQQVGGLPGSTSAVLLQQALAPASSTPPAAALLGPPPPQGLHSPQQQQSGQVQLLHHGPPLVSGAQQGWTSDPVGMPQAQRPQQQQLWQAGLYSGALPEMPKQQAGAEPFGLGLPQGPLQQHPQLQPQQGQGMHHPWGQQQGSLFGGRQAPASLMLQQQQQQDQQRLYGGSAGPPARNGNENGGILGHDLFAGYRQAGGMNSSLFTSVPANNPPSNYPPSNYPPSNWQVPAAQLQQQPPAKDNWSWLDQLEGNT